MATLPTSYQLIEPNLSLVPAVVALFNVAAAFDSDNPATESDLHRQWQQTRMKDVTLVADEQGRIVGVVGAVPMPSKQRLYLLFTVHPDYRQPALIEYLLATIEQYAYEIQPHNTAREITLVHPINGRNLWKRDILPEFDYWVARGLWRLEIVMDTIPDRPDFPDGVQIETFNPDMDLTALQQLVAHTFADSAAPAERQAWLNSVTRDGDYDPSLWYMAKVDGELIGYALCYPDIHLGHVALVGVDEAWQGQGIAVGLLRQSFRGFYQRGIDTVEMHIDSEHPRPQALRVYEKAGMHEVDALLIYEKQLPPTS